MRGYVTALLTISLTLAVGCKSTPAPAPTVTTGPAYPPRPNVPPATFRSIQQTNNSYILVVPEAATNDQLAATLYQLRDAAQAHTFDQLHLSQSFIDARHPKVFFHLYRGAKCAPETFAKGPYPCGPSYHGAADFSIGGFANPSATDGSLVAPDGAVTHLWSAE